MLERDSAPVTTPALSVPKPSSSGPSKPQVSPTQSASQPFTRKSGHLIPATRVYKPKSSRGRRGRNLTLNNNTRTSYQSVLCLIRKYLFLLSDSPFHRTRRATNKRLKYSDKPCPRFTTTGAQAGSRRFDHFVFSKRPSCLVSQYMFTTSFVLL